MSHKSTSRIGAGQGGALNGHIDELSGKGRRLDLRKNIHDAAYQAWGAGLSIVPPMEDGTKKPLGTWKRFQGERASETLVKSWYGAPGLKPVSSLRTGLGIVTGAISAPEGQGLELLEFDDTGAYRAFKETAQEVGLGSLVAAIEAGYLERTPGDGWHLLYFHELGQGVEKPDGNLKLAERPGTNPNSRDVLIETRGEGGFVVVAPSFGKVHPTGNPYELVSGGFDSIASITAAERRELFNLARSFDEMPKSPVEAPPRKGLVAKAGRGTSNSEGLSPGDDYASRHRWADILTDWTLVYTRGETGYWRRPGKSESWSATTNHAGTDTLYVFTASTSFAPHQSYTKFGAYAVLHHKGDHSAAAKALVQQGYGEQRNGIARSTNHRVNGHHGTKGKPATNGFGGNGRQGPEAKTEGPEERPTIIVNVEMKQVIDQGETCLTREENIFHRANMLVRIVASLGETHRWHPERPVGTPMIFPVEEPTLAEMLSSQANWLKPTVTKSGEEVLKPTMPPIWAVKGLRARKAWPLLRPLTGIIETPTIRADGTILNTPGWDELTGLLYQPSINFGEVPEKPTRENAQRAAELLLDVVCDVPFKDRRHASAWLAALLTVIARHSIAGATPLFVFSANIRSTGKSMLCDLIYTIAAGREMPRRSMPTDDEEMGKVIMSIAMAGDPVTMFDNVSTGTPIGSSKLDNVLTATTVQDRPLGTNDSLTLPWRSVLFVTGNNLSVRADTFSRTCWSLIESEEIRPEERRDFKVKGSLVDHARERRAELVIAALTILRAHAIAGRPGADELKGIRSNYQSWSNNIRAAIHWAIGIDPSEIPEDERAIDKDSVTADILVRGWKAVCDAENKNALKVSEVLEVLKESPERHSELRDLFMDWSRDKELPSSKSVGRRLAQFKKRPSRFGSLDETSQIAGIAAWFVREPKNPPRNGPEKGFEGCEGFTNPPLTRDPDGRSLPNNVHCCQGSKHPSHPSKPSEDGREAIEL